MKVLLWAAFSLFVAIALITNWDDRLLHFDDAIGLTRLFLIVVWLAFLAYSILCSQKENLFRTIAEMNKRYWGRQIGLDLYISVGLSIGLVYLVTGSIWQTVLWGIAFLPFANLAILLFVILYLDDLVSGLSSALHAM